MIWISTFVKKKYDVMIRDIQGTDMKTNYKYAVICYLVIASLVFLLISKNFNYTEMFLAGLLAYGIYELTNATIFEKWVATSCIKLDIS